MDHTESASLEIAGDGNSREHTLEDQHKIFLSHSGAQKSFVADLCADLMRRDRHPFFDKLRSSLPVGQKFPDLIFRAIKQCEVGVILLSEEFFTRGKWPMLEVAAMVEETKTRETNRSINFIPAYYSISRERCMNPEVHGDDEVDLMMNWREWEEEDSERIDVENWKKALKECCGPHMGLIKGDAELDGEFRARIVEAVCKIVGPQTRWDDSRVEGKTRLFEDISERIFKGGQPMDLKVGVHVVGLYGMGGVGKTTACKILCNELCSEYHDKVCHVEYGSAHREEELLQMVLRKLSDLEVERMEKLNAGECHGYLKTRLLKDRVFLAMDNVCDESREQAKSLLRAKFGDGSVVLVTARSMDQLLRLGVAKENCFGMPDLELEEAKSVLLNSADLKQNDVGVEFVKTCLRRCYFSMASGREHYHPLALKVLGGEVGAMIRGGKDERAVLSRIGDFNMSRRKEHPVFSILRSSFDSMLEEDQLLFLYIALNIVVILDFSTFFFCTAMEWLCMVHGKDRDEVEDMLESLKRRSLLDSFCEDQYGNREFHMHDLWREFAKEEMRVGKFGDGLRVYEGEVCRGRVDLREYPKLEVVKLRYNGEDVVAVDLRGLKHLRSLEFEFGTNVVTKEVSGLGSLERLTFLALDTGASYECIAEVGLLTNLQVVWLSGFRGDRLPDMSKLTSLRTLNLYNLDFLECINLQNLPSLSGLYIGYCDALRSVDVSGCRLLEELSIYECDLEELNLSSCPRVPSIDLGVSVGSKLRKLNITGCSSLQNFYGPGCIWKLEELRARDCERLAMLSECRLPNLRVLDIESSKFPNGVVRKRCFPNLDLAFEEARALFLNRADVKENDVGEEFVKTCLSRCCYTRDQFLSSPGRQYVGIAVKVLGSGVGDMIRGGKDERAVLSRISDFSIAGDGEHSMFSIMRSIFDFMPEEDQLLFLDVALDCSRSRIGTSTPVEWLCMMHCKHRDEVEDMLERLERGSLLDWNGADQWGRWECLMHDLLLEFAMEEMRVGKFGERRWVFEGENCRDAEGKEARALFLDRADLTENDVGEEFVKTCLSRFCLSRGQILSSGSKQCHALAFKVLSGEVGDMIRGGKDESAVLSRINDFSLSGKREDPVFFSLRSSFDFLPEEVQLLFLDVALELVLFPLQLEWLCVVHGRNRAELDDMLERLKRRSLLDSFGADEDGDWEFHVHGLWRHFAEKQMKVGKFGDRRRVYEGKEWRGSVDLREYPDMEAVKLAYYGNDIVTVEVRGLKHLRSLEIKRGVVGGTVVRGLGTLERLTYLRLWNAASNECIAEVGLLTNLQYVDLSDFRGDMLPDMRQLTSLQTLDLTDSRYLQCVNLQNLGKLTKLYCNRCSALTSMDISGCGSLESVSGFYGLCHLEELNISSCPSIPSLEGLCCLSELRKLNISGCSLMENLDELMYLQSLEELRAMECERLAMLPECRLPNLRVLDIESVKVPIGFATLGDAR